MTNVYFAPADFADGADFKYQKISSQFREDI